MYDPIDIHGNPFSTKSNTYFYNPTDWYDKYKELKQENKKLEKKLKMYEDLKADNNINVIDGKICYRALKDVSIESMEMDDDYQLYLSISGEVLYKDVETDEVIAKKDIDAKVKGGKKCGEL